MKKLNLVLAIAAGLLGGIFSHYVWAPPVQAQSEMTTPKEIRAQSFILVDAKGKVQGVFSAGEPKDGLPVIKLVDGQGHEIWSAGGNGLLAVTTNRK